MMAEMLHSSLRHSIADVEKKLRSCDAIFTEKDLELRHTALRILNEQISKLQSVEDKKASGDRYECTGFVELELSQVGDMELADSIGLI